MEWYYTKSLSQRQLLFLAVPLASAFLIIAQEMTTSLETDSSDHDIVQISSEVIVDDREQHSAKEAVEYPSVSENEANKTSSTEKTSNQSSAIQFYRRLLLHKRMAHKEAVHKIIALESREKQFKMINIILTSLFTVLLKSKAHLAELGYTPGDPFPMDEKTKDALSMVLENTAFVGDILLRLPDVTHTLLTANNDWNLLLRWAVGFCNDTLIYADRELRLLAAMGQELNLVEKDPDYINPYQIQPTKQDENMDLDKTIMADAQNTRKVKVREQKERRQQKGPRMSARHRDEL